MPFPCVAAWAEPNFRCASLLSPAQRRGRHCYLEATLREFLRDDVYVEFSGIATVLKSQLSRAGSAVLARDGYDTNVKQLDVPIKGRYWKSYFRGMRLLYTS